jgi:hypothetical protein
MQKCTELVHSCVCVCVKQSDKLYITTDAFLGRNLATSPHSGLRHQSSNATVPIRTSTNYAMSRITFETRHAGCTKVQGDKLHLQTFLRNKYSVASRVELFTIFTYDLKVIAFMLNHLFCVLMRQNNTM